MIYIYINRYMVIGLGGGKVRCNSTVKNDPSAHPGCGSIPIKDIFPHILTSSPKTVPSHLHHRPSSSCHVQANICAKSTSKKTEKTPILFVCFSFSITRVSNCQQNCSVNTFWFWKTIVHTFLSHFFGVWTKCKQLYKMVRDLKEKRFMWLIQTDPIMQFCSRLETLPYIILKWSRLFKTLISKGIISKFLDLRRIMCRTLDI